MAFEFGRASKVRSAQEMAEVKELNKFPRDPRRGMFQLPEEVRKKISDSLKGRGPMSSAKRAAISEGMKDYHKRERRVSQVGLISLIRKFQGLLYKGRMKHANRVTYRFPGWRPTQILTMDLKVKEGKKAKLMEELHALGLRPRDLELRLWALNSGIVFRIV